MLMYELLLMLAKPPSSLSCSCCKHTVFQSYSIFQLLGFVGFSLFTKATQIGRKIALKGLKRAELLLNGCWML
jgi:hypothetical protein